MPLGGPWADIPTSRFATGRLWSSNLSLEHLARHMGLFGMVGELQIPSTNINGGGVVNIPVEVFYPDEWAFDPTLASLKLVLQMSIRCVITPIYTLDVELSGGSNNPVITATENLYLTKEYTGTLPTGPTTETIVIDPSGIGSAVVSRIGSFGIDCGWMLLPT